MFEEMTGQTYGCMMVDRVELVRYKNGKAKTLCFGHCIHCGSAMTRYPASLRKQQPSYCINCPTSVRLQTPPMDLTGQEFPGLVVLQREGEWKGRNATLWRCRCRVCGKECVVEQMRLKVYKSCGCLAEKGRKKGLDFSRTLFRNSTNYSQISPARKLNKNNKSGVRGVCKGVVRKYRAYINFQGRQIRLGEFDDLEEAIAARKEAEKKYFDPQIEDFEADGIKIKGPYKKKGKASKK